MRRRRREVFAEWFRVKGTGKVRREKEHCRDGSGTERCSRNGSGQRERARYVVRKSTAETVVARGKSGNKFPHSIGGFAATTIAD